MIAPSVFAWAFACVSTVERVVPAAAERRQSRPPTARGTLPLGHGKAPRAAEQSRRRSGPALQPWRASAAPPKAPSRHRGRCAWPVAVLTHYSLPAPLRWEVSVSLAVLVYGSKRVVLATLTLTLTLTLTRYGSKRGVLALPFYLSSLLLMLSALLAATVPADQWSSEPKGKAKLS